MTLWYWQKGLKHACTSSKHLKDRDLFLKNSIMFTNKEHLNFLVKWPHVQFQGTLNKWVVRIPKHNHASFITRLTIHLASRSIHRHLSASQHTSAHMHPSAGYYHGSELEIWMYLYELICWPADKCLSAGLEPAILDWYSHCDDGRAMQWMHKCYQARGIWGQAIWLSEIDSEPNATRTTPPVVSAACEFGTLRLVLSQTLLELPHL